MVHSEKHTDGATHWSRALGHLLVGILKIFFMRIISKVFIAFVTILILFMFWFFGQEACTVLAPRPGIEPTRPTVEGEILSTGPPRKSLTGVLEAA